MKKIVLSLVVFSLVGCAEMQQVLDQLPQGTGVGGFKTLMQQG